MELLRPSHLLVKGPEVKPHWTPESDNNLLPEEDLIPIHNEETTFKESSSLSWLGKYLLPLKSVRILLIPFMW
jgi:hypothetical protein